MADAKYLIYRAFVYRVDNSLTFQIDYLSGYEAYRYGDVFIPILTRDFHRALPMTKDFALFVLSKLESDAKRACVIAPYHPVTEWETKRFLSRNAD